MEKVKTIILTKDIFTQLMQHIKNSLPYESVSIMAGHIKGTTAYAELLFKPENIEKSQVSFTIDSMELLEIYNEIELKNKQLIAICHNHPAPPKPSGVDLYYMEVNPYIWLICSSTKPDDIKGYFLYDGGQLKEIDVIIEMNNKCLREFY